MIEYNEIKDIILNKLGITDLEAYSKWLAAFHERDSSKRRIVTQEDIDLLSPDRIHNGDFWKVIGEIFGVDCVANTMNKTLSDNVDVGNLRNLGLASMMGALNFVDEWRHGHFPVLEIGPGYGNFKSNCQMTTDFMYAGVDIYPKIPGIFSTTPQGTLDEEFVETGKDKMQIVYSSNVFQHLSNKQRSKYYADIHKILHPKGVFIFNLLVHFYNPADATPETRSAFDGRQYLKHYGQMTEVPFYPELMDELGKYFYILYECRRRADDLF
ncbi:MAG: methyltransferase domain-containing protein, partial [Candidatus Omnitrophica bacterium]|nr:methyltransferase domain-containing protein [Candidatus Omnitrophota bacterium]